jgi:hypothetical protein
MGFNWVFKGLKEAKVYVNCFIWHLLRVLEERNHEGNLINCKSSHLVVKQLKDFFIIILRFYV